MLGRAGDVVPRLNFRISQLHVKNGRLTRGAPAECAAVVPWMRSWSRGPSTRAFRDGFGRCSRTCCGSRPLTLSRERWKLTISRGVKIGRKCGHRPHTPRTVEQRATAHVHSVLGIPVFVQLLSMSNHQKTDHRGHESESAPGVD